MSTRLAHALFSLGLASTLALSLACGPAIEGATDSAGDPDEPGTGTGPAECPEEVEPIVTPEDYAYELAKAVCEKAAACGCGDIPEHCIETKVDDYTQRNALFLARGGVFQPECARRLVQRRQWATCDSYYQRGSVIDTDPDFPCDDCRDFVGPLAEGEACEYPLYYDNHLCQDGLICNAELCTKPLPVVGEGGLCSVGFGPGMNVGECAEGTICDHFSGYCAPLPKEGEACIGNYFCGLDMWCDNGVPPDGVCRLNTPAGEACDAEGDAMCASFVCEENTCSDDPWFCLELF